MTLHYQEVPLLESGMNLARADKRHAAWIQNMFKRQGAWETRPGLGQVAQLDTAFTTVNHGSQPQITTLGYRTHLGSHFLKTSFGHEQIVSVFLADITPTMSEQVGTVPEAWRTMHVVSIYDLTTGTSHEEALFPQTADQAHTAIPVERIHGLYESSRARSYLHANTADIKEFWFLESDDMLLLGSPTAGAWAYVPSIFPRRRRTGADISARAPNKTDYSENCVVMPVVARDGLYPLTYTYLDKAGFPKPTCAATLRGCVVYAEGRTVYIADPRFPSVIAGANTFDVGCKGTISAMMNVGDALIILTDRLEYWYFAPAAGYVQAAGRLMEVSSAIGCLGPNCIVKTEGTVFWADQNNVWYTTNGLSAKPLGNEIRPFFFDSVTNPMTNFYLGSGFSDGTSPQPRTRYDFTDRTGVSLAWDAKYGSLMLSVPSQNIVWVYQGGWHLWNVESVAYADGSTPKVRAVQNIKNPWMLASGTDIYCVGGLDNTLRNDTQGFNNDFYNNSYYLLKMGLGGGTDRSVDGEDFRQGKGMWRKRRTVAGLDVKQDAYSFWFGDPIPVPSGKSLSLLTAPSDFTLTTTAADWFLVPVYLITSNQEGTAASWAGTTQYRIRFKFDSTNFELAFDPGDLVHPGFILPSERINTRAAFDVPVAGSFEVVGANEVLVVYNHSASAPGAYSAAIAAHVGDFKNPLFWLPVRYKGGAVVASMGIDKGVVDIADVTGAGVHECEIMVFERSFWPASAYSADDNVAQGVDWAYKTQQVGMDGKTQFVARGVAANLISRGKATTRLITGWPWGVYNLLLGADWKDWSSQIIDYVEANRFYAIWYDADKETVRARMMNVSMDLIKRTFGGGAKWSTNAGATSVSKGYILVDDEQCDEIVTSDLAHGQHFSFMLFGSILSHAEKLKINNARALFNLIGPARRKGR